MFHRDAIAVAGPDRGGLRPDLAACFARAPRSEPGRPSQRLSGVLAELASGGSRD
jgi:hypothetical protein